MRPIPLSMRNQIANDETRKACAVAGKGFGPCHQKIDFEHAWIYAGKQINELWAIVKVCRTHHQMKDGNREVKAIIERASLERATDDDLAKYPRKNWTQIRRSLGLS